MVIVYKDNDIVSNKTFIMFDGDQVTCKGVYTTEANDELEEFMNSKENFMDFGCKPLRESTADVIQSIYALTKVLRDTTITKSSSIQYR